MSETPGLYEMCSTDTDFCLALINVAGSRPPGGMIGSLNIEFQSHELMYKVVLVHAIMLM